VKGFLIMLNQIKRGEVYYCDLGKGFQSEQGGLRPVLICQNDKGNIHSTTTLIAPLTSSKTKHKLPTHVAVESNGIHLKDSIVLLEQIKVVSKDRLKDYVTYLDESIMGKVDTALAISLGLSEPKKGKQNGFNTQFAY
jgi:mRNA interferase MazF